MCYTAVMTFLRVTLAALMGLLATAPVGVVVAHASTHSDQVSVSSSSDAPCPQAPDHRIYFATCGGFF